MNHEGQTHGIVFKCLGYNPERKGKTSPSTIYGNLHNFAVTSLHYQLISNQEYEYSLMLSKDLSMRMKQEIQLSSETDVQNIKQ